MLTQVPTELISSFADVGVAGAAIFAAWQGIKGLNAWRTEQLGTRKIELAEEALTHFYQIEHAFDHIRSPISDASESEDRVEQGHESSAQKHARDIAHTTWKRLNAQADLFQSFYVTGLTLRAHFGEEIYDQCKNVRRCFGRVRVAAQMLYDTPFNGYADHEFRQKLEADIWDMRSEDSESIEQIIKSAVSKAESVLGGHLK